MEIIKVKCLNCMAITSVSKDILIPHQGKIVSIKCSNPACGKPMKVQVPEMNKKPEGNEDSLDFPPTQILASRKRLAQSGKIRILKNDKTEEQIFDLKEGVNTVGRFSVNSDHHLPDIPIYTQDKKISRNYHCEIIVTKSEKSIEIILRDPHSKNGTFLSGSEKPLSHEDEIFLKDKDVFVIGETKIQLEIE